MSRCIIIPVNLLILISELALGQAYFEDVALKSGIEHKHIAPNLMGGGVAVLDYNNDGFEDLYFTGGTYEDKLYKNNGDGTFQSVGVYAGIYNETRIIQTTSAIAGDIDNDGWDDIFISTEPGEYNILFHNKQDGTFENISFEAGILNKSWSMGAAFIDINQDGFLDIYVINYIDEAIPTLDNNGIIVGFEHICFPNSLYINDGSNNFTDYASDYGLDSNGCGLAVTVTDVNNDQIPDIYIANDFGEWVIPNQVYINNYPLTQCSEIGSEINLDVKLYGMGISSGDIDKDGLIDYYVTNLGKNALLKNTNDNVFENITDDAGVGNEKAGAYNSTGWGTQLFDMDNDGDDDLFVANGYIGAASFLQTTIGDPNKLYLNNGSGTYSDISVESNMDNTLISRGSATLDMDNDGDLDLVVSNIDNVGTSVTNISLYRNIIGQNKNWLKVKLIGDQTNRKGYGAKLYCYSNSNIFVKEVYGGGSHASKSSSIAHFGLDTISVLDSIKVIWPGGIQQYIYNIKTNQFLQIEEGKMGFEVIGCMEETNLYYNEGATSNNGCLIPQVINSIDEIDFNSRFSLVPNPASNSIELEGNLDYPLKIEIIDIQGETITSKTLLKRSEKIDVSNFPVGLYFLIVDQNQQKKLIKN